MSSGSGKSDQKVPASPIKAPLRKVVTNDSKKYSPSRDSNVVNVYVIGTKLGVVLITTEKANKTAEDGFTYNFQELLANKEGFAERLDIVKVSKFWNDDLNLITTRC